MLNSVSDEELRQMYWAEGLSGREIASVLGCSVAAISMRMKASGIPTRKPHDYPPTDKQRAAWKRNGFLLGTDPARIESARVIGRRNKGKRRRDDYEFGGHEKRRADGYISVFVPSHPHASSDGYVMKHTLVMERHIGRYLEPDEVVHHINRKRDDNHLENLELMTKKEHMSLHMKERHAERRKSKC